MPLDFAELNKKKNQRFGKGWTPDPGDNEIRILPPTSDYFTDMIGFIALEYRNHFVRLDGHDIQVFRCLRDFDEKCPACSFYYDYRNDDDPAVKSVASKFNPSTRFAFNIIDLNAPQDGIQTYECGVKVHNEILKYAANENWGDILSVEQDGRGFTVTLTPPHQGDNNSDWNQYSVMPHPNPKSVEHHLPEGWKDSLDALADDIPEKPERDKVESLVDTAAVEVGIMGNQSAPTAARPSASKQEEQESGFSAEVSEPEVQEPVATSEPEEEDEEPTPEEPAVVTESADGGPEIDPETGKPVCFGKYDDSKYPCDACDVVRDCHIAKLGIS